MKLDILVFAAHPDDAELSCSGTIMKHVAAGYKVGIVDLTEGQLGTRGSVEERYSEAEAASKIMGLHVRENLQMADGFFENDGPHRLKVIEMLRKYRPDVVFCNAISDRHPDHGRGSELVSKACFYSGLKMIPSEMDGLAQEAWRPRVVYHYIQDYYHKPDVIVDISGYWERKVETIMAFKTQFFNPNSQLPNTPISGPEFLGFLEGRAMEYGRLIKASHGEGFTVERPLGTDDMVTLL